MPDRQVLGRGLAKLPRDEIVVATKVGRYGPDDFDFSAERVTRSVHESLQRLQIQYVDLIQTHDVEFVHLDQVSFVTEINTMHRVLFDVNIRIFGPYLAANKRVPPPDARHGVRAPGTGDVGH
jgi:aryl-alcohol dehydrogenase-like predicted oxidoreductase